MIVKALDKFLAPIWGELELEAIRVENGIRPDADVDSEDGVLYRDLMLYELRKWLATCRDCQLSKSRHNVVPCDLGSSVDSGGKMPGLMVIAEGPGYAEDLCQIPLVGIYELLASDAILSEDYEKAFAYHLGLGKKEWGYTCNDVTYSLEDPIPQRRLKTKVRNIHTAGNMLDNFLQAGGFHRAPWNTLLMRLGKDHRVADASVAVTNAIRCRSFEVVDSRDRNLTPSVVSLGCCHRYLDAEVGLIMPKEVLLLGAPALSSFYWPQNTPDLGRMVGSNPHDPPSRFSGFIKHVWVYQHPAYIMRQEGAQEYAVLYDGFGSVVKRVREALDG